MDKDAEIARLQAQIEKLREIGDKLAAYLSKESRQYNLLASYPEEENFICSVCGKGPHAEDCALINALEEWEEAKQ